MPKVLNGHFNTVSRMKLGCLSAKTTNRPYLCQPNPLLVMIFTDMRTLWNFGVSLTALVAGHQSFNKYCTAAAAPNPQTCTFQSQGCHILITTVKCSCSLLNISHANTTKNSVFLSDTKTNHEWIYISLFCIILNTLFYIEGLQLDWIFP